MRFTALFFRSRLNRISIGLLLSFFFMPGGQAQTTAGAASPPPLPPEPKPFTEFFRQLLAAPETQRAHLLSNKPPELRAIFQNKLQEYAGMSSVECEMRLQALDLRWYLASLIPLASTQRVERLLLVPEKDRSLVRERLRLWDQLPPTLQKEVLDNEAAIVCLSGGCLSSKEGPSAVASERRRYMEAAVQSFQSLPPHKRQEIYNYFNKIFAPHQPGRPWNDGSQQQLAILFPALKTMPAEQRAQTLRGFQKYVALSAGERTEFFRNAALWQEMTEEDRRLFIQLNRHIPPPPPGLERPGASKPPPLPPSDHATSFATNQ